MILVIGGYASGKRQWVSDHLGYGEDAFTSDPSVDLPVLYDLQDHCEEVTADELLGRAVIICNEVGCGVVPATSEERAARECTGRLCCDLAAQADCVVRVTCGIGAVIKGALPC